MKVTFFKGESVSIYFMYLTQLSEKQTICSTPSLQIKQFSDIKHLFLQRFSLFQRKISFFECVSFLPLFLVKIQQRVIRNLKPERSLALQMNTSLARRSLQRSRIRMCKSFNSFTFQCSSWSELFHFTETNRRNPSSQSCLTFKRGQKHREIACS